MESYIKHFHRDGRADYGKGIAIAVSLTLHMAVLGGLLLASTLTEKKEPPMSALTDRLGGPPTMAVSGKKRKAPVRVSRGPNPRRKKRPPIKDRLPRRMMSA